MSTVEIKLDDDLLALVDERAASSGIPRNEVIAEALRRRLEGGRLREILDAGGERSDPSEDEAIRIAIAVPLVGSSGCVRRRARAPSRTLGRSLGSSGCLPRRR